MKITANKVNAILFTLIAIAAFIWMTLRPNVNAQIAGFAMPVPVASEKISASEEVVTPTSTDTTTNATTEKQQSTDKIEADSTEKASAQTTAPTGDTAALESTKEEQPNSDIVETEATIEPINDSEELNKDETTKDSATKDSTPKQEPEQEPEPEAQQAADPKPVTLEDNKIEEHKIEQQLAEKKKTYSGNSGDFIDENTVIDNTQKPEATTLSTLKGQSETPKNPVDNLTNEELKAESIHTTEAKLKVASLTNTDATNRIQPLVAPIPQVIPTPETSNSDTVSTTTYTSAEKARGTVVILHGCDYQANVQHSIVQALHKNLPQAGWNTLSFQLPTLSSTSSYQDLNRVMQDAATQIESNIAIAKEKSQTPVVLLAHGCGSHMALAWMEVKGNDKVDAYIGIGTGMMNTSAKDIHLSMPLEKMKFPQLDIFGSADNEAVLRTAQQRLGHINRAANPASRQKIIADADHNMTGKTEQLSKTITKWLNKKAFIDK